MAYQASKMNQKPILCIKRSIPDIHKSIQNSTRLKFLCIDVSSSLICLGGKTGSIYIFDRSNGHFIKFISHKVHGIKILKFSHDEKLLAAVDSSGKIICWEVSERNDYYKVFKELDHFTGQQVTSICWSNVKHCLYVGNNNGLVMAFYMGYTGFVKSGSEIIRKSGDPIVQVDCFNNYLIISSTTKAILCYIDKGQFHTIGKKPRDGMYGSCFVKSSTSDVCTKIFAARPGSRLWEVDFAGQVNATHQFKELLAIPPTEITICCRNITLDNSAKDTIQPQSFNFPYLCTLLNRYIFTWSQKGIYIFDTYNGQVLYWNDQIKSIKSISCVVDTIYILHENGSVTELMLQTIKQCLLTLNKNELWTELAQLAFTHEGEILVDVESFLSIDFYEILVRLKDEDDCLEGDTTVPKFEAFVNKFNDEYSEVRAVIQERLNQVLINENTSNSADSGVEDGDDIRSNISDGGISESSSRISLSRLAEVNLESVMQKATTALVSKVVNSGFMKKALREALQAEGVILDNTDNSSQNYRHHVLQHTQSVPNSPKMIHKKLSLTGSNESISAESALPSTSSVVQRKSHSVPSLTYGSSGSSSYTDDIVIQRVRTGKKSKKKKKKKLINLDSSIIRDIPSDVTSSVTSSLEDSMKIDVVLKPNDAENNDVVVQPPVQNSLIQHTSFLDPNFKHDIFQVDGAENHNGVTFKVARKSLADNNHDLSEQYEFKLTDTSFQIISNLVNTTAITRNKFRDPGVLYNPMAIHDILNTWSNQLENTCKDFQEECLKTVDENIMKNININILNYFEITTRELLFSQLAAAFGEISNVAMLCLESGIFSAGCSHLKNHEIQLLHFDSNFDEIFHTAVKDINLILEKSKTLSKNDKEVADIENKATSDSENKITNFEKKDSTDSNKTCSEDCQAVEECTPPQNSIQPENNLENIENQPVNDLLYDKQSLSTIASESDTITSFNLFGSENYQLKDNLLLCENANTIVENCCESCEFDKLRASFVLSYFPILNFSRIRSLLLWKGGCRWRTLSACIIHLKKLHSSSELSQAVNNGDLSLISKILQNTNEVEVLLANADRISDIAPELFDELIVNDKLSAWEILLLYQLNHQTTTDTNIKIYLDYAFKNINKYQDDYLFIHCSLHHALSFQPDSKKLFCMCDTARAGSNTLQWEWSQLLDQLIQLVMKCYSSVDDQNILSKFKELCQTKGYWRGYLELTCYMNKKKEVIKLLTQLQDFDLFSNLLKKDKVQLTEKDWSELLSTLNATNTGTDYCKCDPVDGWVATMNLENVIKLAAQYTNASFVLSVMKLLKSNLIFTSGLYTSILKAGELENRQESLVRRLIEVASSNVWSSNKSIIHPQLNEIKQAELRGEESIRILPNNITETEFVMNEADTVWGHSIKVSKSDCVICRLPLCLKTVSTATAGLIVFRCGHTFHKICVPENACLVCYHDNFTTLY